MQFGCLPAKADLRDYKICSSNIQQEYPKEFILDNLPKVKNQGIVNSCCAHATSSILEYYTKNTKTLSTNFLYGIQKKLFNQDGPGMYMSQACKIVKDYGDPLEQDCPGNTEVPKAWTRANLVFSNESAMQEAYKYRTLSYFTCKTDNDIKYALMTYGPVLGAIDWYENYTLDNNAVVNFDLNSANGGHAIVICGWNETGWIIQNSWGEGWGNKGRFIMPFSYKFLETRAIIDYEETDDTALCKPINNKWLNPCYKIVNWFINLFK